MLCVISKVNHYRMFVNGEIPAMSSQNFLRILVEITYVECATEQTANQNKFVMCTFLFVLIFCRCTRICNGCLCKNQIYRNIAEKNNAYGKNNEMHAFCVQNSTVISIDDKKSLSLQIYSDIGNTAKS